MPGPNTITPKQLLRLIGTPDCPPIIDVGTDEDFACPRLIRRFIDPAAAGLLAFSVGLSRQFRNDPAQLYAGMTVHDALYRWVRDGQSERHAWHEERV